MKLHIQLIALILTFQSIVSCQKEDTSPRRSFLGDCSCVDPYVEDIALDTCVFDPIKYTTWASINNIKVVQKLAPGEQLVVYYPLSSDSAKTWQILDTLVRERLVLDASSGWSQEILTHSRFRRADHYLYSNSASNPIDETLYDDEVGRSYAGSLGELYYWTKMSRFRAYDHLIQSGLPSGTRVDWIGTGRIHPLQRYIEGPDDNADWVDVVGHWYVPENLTDTTFGFIGYRNYQAFNHLTPQDTTYTYCRVKYFDPPARLRNDEW